MDFILLLLGADLLARWFGPRPVGYIMEIRIPEAERDYKKDPLTLEELEYLAEHQERVLVSLKMQEDQLEEYIHLVALCFF